jgi:hypothetical protein
MLIMMNNSATSALDAFLAGEVGIGYHDMRAF